LKALGRLDDAIASIDAGLQYDTNNQVAIQDKATLIQSKEKFEKVILLMEQKKFREAIIIIDSLVSTIGSSFQQLNIMKIKVLVELRRPEEAYNLSNIVMRSAANYNNDSELLYLRAKCLYAMNDPENALKHLQQAMRLDPDNTQVRVFLRKLKDMETQKEAGTTAFQAGSYQEAIRCWTGCLSLDPDNKPYNSKIYYNRAVAQLKLRKPEDAARDCDRAISMDPEYLKAYIKRAEANFTAGGADRLKQCIR